MAGASYAAPFNPATDIPPIGMNMAEPRPYMSAGHTFVDVAKLADDAWKSPAVGSTTVYNDFTRDANGYPIDILGRQPTLHILTTQGKGLYPKGDMILEWDGDGEVFVQGRTHSSIQTSPTGSKYRTVTIPSDSMQGYRVSILSSNPANHVRNIRLWAQGYRGLTGEQAFHPAFLAVQNSAGLLRFMDWNGTNGSPEVNWSDRRQPNWFSQQIRIAYEYQIDLCNALNADYWLCVPHMATISGTDSYVANLARLVKNRLKPGLRVWVEYSNEIWNGSFAVHGWTAQQAGATQASPAHAQWAGARAAQVFQVFATEFGGLDRIVRVAAVSNTNVNNWSGNFLDGVYSVGAADVVATATYMHDGMSQKLADGEFGVDFANPTDDDYQRAFDYLHTTLRPSSVSNTYERWEGIAAIASARGLPLISYEGGTHFGLDDPSLYGRTDIKQFLHNMQKEPRIKRMLRLGYENFYALGGRMHNAFVNLGNPSTAFQGYYWGHLDHEFAPVSTAYKFQSLVEWAEHRTGVDRTPFIQPLFTPLRRLVSAQQGKAYGHTFTFTAGDGAQTWALAAGGTAVPQGISVSNGVLSGYPHAQGDHDFLVRVTDADGDVDELPVRLQVEAPYVESPHVASEDSYGRSTNPTTTYGTATTLEIKDDTGNATGISRVAYLKFNLASAGLSSVLKAELELNVTTADATDIEVRDSADGWSESTLTWNTRPTLGSVLGQFNGRATGKVRVDVTAFVNAQLAGDDVASFALTAPVGSQKLVRVGSVNNTDANLRPRLILRLADTVAFQQDAGTGLVSMEAENFRFAQMRGSDTWVTASSFAGGSGGSYLTTPGDSGDTYDSNIATTASRVDFPVNFKASGTHYVWVRMRGATIYSDSIHVGLNGTVATTADKINSGSSWNWYRSSLDGPSAATLSIPSVGRHTVNVWVREDGVMFDKIVITNSSTYVPSGEGPAQSPVQ